MKYLFFLCLVTAHSYAQQLTIPVQTAKPLDKLLIMNEFGNTITVCV